MRAGLCPAEKQELCEAQFGKHLAWACRKCKHRRPSELSGYTMSLLGIRRMIKAGYPMRANDLQFSQWQDLGALSETIESLQGERQDRLLLSLLTGWRRR